jgi:putative tricarboxylic transport membrane protein
MIESLLLGFDLVFSVSVLLAILAGSVIGYFVGALPGLTPSIGIAVLVPITYTMDPVPAIILLVSLYCAAEYGGGITAILLNAPGTPAAAATAWDGYPLAANGQAGKALSVSIISSGVAAFISSVLLIFTAVPMARFALQFGPMEYFALAIFGLSLISSLSEGSIIKGFIAMFFGLLIISVGIDPIVGIPRFAFAVDLLGGIPFLPALVGLFALSEVLFMIENSKEKPKKIEKITGLGLTWAEVMKMKMTFFVKAPLIGYVIGVIPGAGATIASLISYNEAKRASKDKESFGKGNIEGIAAAEGANNSAVPGALAPLLSLGIPGSASAAILIGALTMQGLQAGPKMFAENPEIPYSLFASLLISVPVMVIMGLMGVKMWVNVTKIPKNVLAVIVAGICIIGAYTYSNSMYSVWIMIIFGIFGYFIRKIGIPTTPIVLAMVLGFMMEVNFRRAMIISEGDLFFIFTRPISLVLVILSIITLVVPIIQSIKNKKKNNLNLGV